MVFDKYVELEINGKKHRMCYPNKYVWEMERQLSNGNIQLTVMNAGRGTPPTLYDTFTIIKYAFLGGNPKLTEDEAEELYMEAVAEHPLLDVFTCAMEALTKSGILGQVKKAPAAPKKA